MFNLYRGRENLDGHLMAAIDIETTGRLPGFHEIIQIAVVPLDFEFNPMPHIIPFYTYIAPEYPERNEKEAKSIHGINLEKLALEALPAWKVADLFSEWFDHLELPIYKKLIPLAHNWAFEAGFLKHWLGLEAMDNMISGLARDSMLLANSINDWFCFRGEERPFSRVKLPILCTQLKIQQPGTSHDALNDSLQCAALYKVLLQRFPYA
jgi:DNA polymerase III epsilon subunit-like protein